MLKKAAVNIESGIALLPHAGVRSILQSLSGWPLFSSMKNDAKMFENRLVSKHKGIKVLRASTLKI